MPTHNVPQLSLPGFKICTACDVLKELAAFPLRKDDRGNLYRMNRCRDCTNRHRRKRHANGLVKALTYQEIKRRKALLEQGLKECCTCKEVKSLEEFYVNKSLFDRRFAECKICHYARSKYDKNADEDVKARWSRYRRTSLLRRTYGIEPEEYDALLQAQSGGCAICGAVTSAKTQRQLDIDHDHVTGKVRGILCVNCNQGLGKFRDNPDRLRRAADYLEAASANPEG